MITNKADVNSVVKHYVQRIREEAMVKQNDVYNIYKHPVAPCPPQAPSNNVYTAVMAGKAELKPMATIIAHAKAAGLQSNSMLYWTDVFKMPADEEYEAKQAAYKQAMKDYNVDVATYNKNIADALKKINDEAKDLVDKALLEDAATLYTSLKTFQKKKTRKIIAGEE